MRATHIVHWPGKDTPACELHARGLTRIANAIGFPVTSSLCVEEVECINCINELQNKVRNRLEDVIPEVVS